MTIPEEFTQISHEVFRAIFGRDCPYSPDELKQKFARDIQLPVAVEDSTTGEEAWSAMVNATKYITDTNSSKRDETQGWMLPARDLKGIQDILKTWEEVNYITTDRVYGCERVYASDPVYTSSDIYNSTNCGDCQKMMYCDGTYDSTNAIACQRSTGLNYCLRTDDSNTCTNCYSVICSSKVSNSFFIQDASNLHECMFCSHISNHEYCIANMQFDRETYLKVKAKVVDWILAK